MLIPTDILFLYCDTLLHAGVGSDTSFIDLPIQREGVTDLPTIFASSLKGAKRRFFSQDESNGDKVNLIFGPKLGDDDTGRMEYAGSLMITDARLLAFPVKSAVGSFAWVTSMSVLHKLQQDIQQVSGEIPSLILPDVKTIEKGQAFATINSKVCTQIQVADADKPIVHAFLEEFKFVIDSAHNETVQLIANWIACYAVPTSYAYYADRLKSTLIILNDDDFRYFTRFSTEVRDRISIDETTGTVTPGALWTEEALPSESILYTVVRMLPLYSRANHSKEDEEVELFPSDTDALSWLSDTLCERFQIGGNQTLSQGIVMPQWLSTVPSEQIGINYDDQSS